MNEKTAKKLRREAKKLVSKRWMEYYNAILDWPLKARLRFAWSVLKGKRPFWKRNKKV